ncbi:alpha-ketoacid dehydrogenase subunit beta [Kutzneria sp. CA-103260]|uniref:alpha-ketoacid dehydrogenase subunit beta n=1 Tax=Kutzneria sp. CA-103260 TaxID=2802641 RepID=UPI001BEFF708|nr:transketolase C-terminal domain-containing protein [Kutzneria sp. CA-103260]QUQ67045.1 pyruvate dehydrogenase subunit beta [Kutzneria sp. CA-103260]
MERVVENLNRALGGLLDRDPSVYLLGEDVVDPYGGAFKATRGLSTRHPDRVLATPISEGALVGVANGLALSGGKAVVEIMFSDFVALAFDQIVNFAAKSVSMYGHTVPMPVVVRCPTGGGRGYGPTHSQSLQKHFIGVPGLSVYEMSPFLDNASLLELAMADGRPAVLFEDKVLYGQRMHQDGVVDELFGYELVDPESGTTVVSLRDDAPCDCVLIAPGGLSARVLAAARELFVQEEICCRIVVPGRLYPFAVEPLLDLLGSAGLVCVVEDSSAGGTWGTEVATLVYRRLWGRLARPVALLSAADSIIPTAAHLEREVLPQAEDIRDLVIEALRA